MKKTPLKWGMVVDTFGAQLSAARRAKGYTQEQLAELLSVSRTSVSRWESDRVMPDLETIKRLSVLLEYNFFPTRSGTAAQIPDIVEVIPEQPMPAQSVPVSEEPPSSVPADAAAPKPQKKSHKPWIIAGVCLLAAVCLAFLVPVLLRIPKANIVVEPLEPVAYLQEYDDMNGGKGWEMTFAFTNTTDVGFTPDHVMVRFYEDNRIDNKLTMTYDEIRPWMDNDRLLKTDTSLQLLFGTNYTYLTRMECEIYGTDDNGHWLQFKGSVDLLKSEKE
jgi:transcriptional regulator with XRE-family HTH domain